MMKRPGSGKLARRPQLSKIYRFAKDATIIMSGEMDKRIVTSARYRNGLIHAI
jgi:hypothetical protein